MKFYITYFYNVRFLWPNQIPISTAIWDPPYYKLGNGKRYKVADNGVVLGIKEDSLIYKGLESLKEQCQKGCPYASKAPRCEFMLSYIEQLRQIDFEGYLLPEFRRIAEDVRKITNYSGEPEIVLLVHEKPDVVCAERPCLVQVFNERGIELAEWHKGAPGGIVF